MEDSEVIVVDDAPSATTQSRILYGKALEHANSVVLITRKPIDDHLVRVPLGLTHEDLLFVAASLRSLGESLKGPTETEPGLLWNYFRIGVE
jgi:hypothetical protein